jgi:dimeric dUTPase (all-alpha-NTP-PPase superfamily)
MNLTKLFETQKILRDRIDYNSEDRFEKLVLALLVELGECANEWRGFKFWSTDQEPRKSKKIMCPTCKGSGMIPIGEGVRGIKKCPDCDNPRGGMKTVYPLLEEYVDVLHFVLDIGIEVNEDKNYSKYEFESQLSSIHEIIEQFSIVYTFALGMFDDNYYRDLFYTVMRLGEKLGFTEEEIEQAYYDKNKINHQRQDVGY